ncbi:hypothetical protein XAC2852_470025 [Xanthomonas citri pv. citri]|uniref:Uncharacterized protein n=1 Tax=Xanthomonas citri pv. citri TaxID=611301 RepID=A0A0U5FEA0_XANCI|nr:hypothetical protein XAC2852_470025 [Xanthomonas citri pv. citri]CEG16605.1 hypothetical protein XAC3562_450024 [Xanthomonas citri pv. citri]CEH80051.1 hypothetical protein XACB100_1210024 [Xanthomonas citri pv. citri]
MNSVPMESFENENDASPTVTLPDPLSSPPGANDALNSKFSMPVLKPTRPSMELPLVEAEPKALPRSTLTSAPPVFTRPLNLVVEIWPLKVAPITRPFSLQTSALKGISSSGSGWPGVGGRALGSASRSEVVGGVREEVMLLSKWLDKPGSVYGSVHCRGNPW